MHAHIAETYRHFAEAEARGISASYEALAQGVSKDLEILDLIGELPGLKIQPNLVFASARLLGAPVGSYPEFRTWLIAHWNEVVPQVLARATQTNEASRCAAMLPVLSRLHGPLALIEAGASAGLCLYPDHYSYRYTTSEGSKINLHPDSGPSSVVLPCAIDADWVPTHVPEVIYRAGVDLNPLDVGDADQFAWLETLIWPEHGERRARLHAAARIALEEPARIIAGDLTQRIPELIEAAPANAHVVVFHTWVLYYLSLAEREKFRDTLAGYPQVTWISSEPAGVLPWVDERHKTPFDHRVTLAVNGRPAALVGTHGQSFEPLRRVDPIFEP